MHKVFRFDLHRSGFTQVEISLIGGLFFYQMAALILYEKAGLDIGISCLITTITGVHCPGCGMSRAFFALIKGDLHRAAEYNVLVFVLVAFLGFRFFKSYLFDSQLKEK
ncbi:MAG: DUF2752 domain-containing protein [Bacteroidetes bacterium]|nr:DUF2752 domain-containing protein [Bacteroidota bacterium]